MSTYFYLLLIFLKSFEINNNRDGFLFTMPNHWACDDHKSIIDDEVKNTYRYHNGYIENQFEQKKFSFLVILVHKTNYYQRSDILSVWRKMFWIDFLHFVLISRSVQFQLSLKKFWNIFGLISFLFPIFRARKLFLNMQNFEYSIW